MDLPVNAQAIVKIISRTLSEADPREESRFENNTQAYLKELKDLDSRFRQVVNQGRLHMIVVADKFPFRYFADEYGLSYRAAFSGCSGDTEPSARTIAYLIDKVKGGPDSGGLLPGAFQPQDSGNYPGGNRSSAPSSPFLPQRDQEAVRRGSHLSPAYETECGEPEIWAGIT